MVRKWCLFITGCIFVVTLASCQDPTDPPTAEINQSDAVEPTPGPIEVPVEPTIVSEVSSNDPPPENPTDLPAAASVDPTVVSELASDDSPKSPTEIPILADSNPTEQPACDQLRCLENDPPVEVTTVSVDCEEPEIRDTIDYARSTTLRRNLINYCRIYPQTKKCKCFHAWLRNCYPYYKSYLCYCTKF